MRARASASPAPAGIITEVRPPGRARAPPNGERRPERRRRYTPVYEDDFEAESVVESVQDMESVASGADVDQHLVVTDFDAVGNRPMTTLSVRPRPRPRAFPAVAVAVAHHGATGRCEGSRRVSLPDLTDRSAQESQVLPREEFFRAKPGQKEPRRAFAPSPPVGALQTEEPTDGGNSAVEFVQRAAADELNVNACDDVFVEDLEGSPLAHAPASQKAQQLEEEHYEEDFEDADDEEACTHARSHPRSPRGLSPPALALRLHRVHTLDGRACLLRRSVRFSLSLARDRRRRKQRSNACKSTRPCGRPRRLRCRRRVWARGGRARARRRRW